MLINGGACLRAAVNDFVLESVDAAHAVDAEGRQNGFWAMLDLKSDYP